jgi:hypothetical protein
MSDDNSWFDPAAVITDNSEDWYSESHNHCVWCRANMNYGDFQYCGGGCYAFRNIIDAMIFKLKFGL